MRFRYHQVALGAFGHERPPVVASSAGLEERLRPVYERLKLPEGRLEMMSGIRERRFWMPGTRPSEAAAMAGRKALANSGVPPEAVECLVFSAVCRDMMEPATASFVHHALGLGPRCQVFDLSNACLGFMNAMASVANMIELGQIETGLVVAGETAEDLVESTIAALLADPALTRKSIKDSFASLTIGSGAVALVLTAARPGQPARRLLGGACQANTGHSQLCQGGGTNGSGILMRTDSEELMKRGVETARETWPEFLDTLGWEPTGIGRIVTHQVGRAHARLLFETLGLDESRSFETLSHMGNIGSVAAPLTLAMAHEAGRIAPGDTVAMLGIGSGINCLMLGIEWR